MSYLADVPIWPFNFFLGNLYVKFSLLVKASELASDLAEFYQPKHEKRSQYLMKLDPTPKGRILINMWRILRYEIALRWDLTVCLILFLVLVPERNQKQRRINNIIFWGKWPKREQCVRGFTVEKQRVRNRMRSMDNFHCYVYLDTWIRGWRVFTRCAGLSIPFIHFFLVHLSCMAGVDYACDDVR